MVQGASIAELTMATDASADWGADSTKACSNSGACPSAASRHDDLAGEWPQPPFRKEFEQAVVRCRHAAGMGSKSSAGAATAEAAARGKATTAAQLAEVHHSLAALNVTVSVLQRRMDGYRCTVDADGLQVTAHAPFTHPVAMQSISSDESHFLGCSRMCTGVYTCFDGWMRGGID